MFESLFPSTSIVGLGLMAGATFYISLVEIPARQQVVDASMQLQNWQSVFPYASGVLKPFGIILTPVLVLTGVFTGQWIWYGSAIVLIALVPFTAIWIAQTNDVLLAMTMKSLNHDIVTTIQRWDKLHNIRTVICLLAFLLGVLAISL